VLLWSVHHDVFLTHQVLTAVRLFSVPGNSSVVLLCYYQQVSNNRGIQGQKQLLLWWAWRNMFPFFSRPQFLVIQQSCSRTCIVVIDAHNSDDTGKTCIFLPTILPLSPANFVNLRLFLVIHFLHVCARLEQVPGWLEQVPPKAWELWLDSWNDHRYFSDSSGCRATW